MVSDQDGSHLQDTQSNLTTASMSTARRSKALPTEGQTAKFLYAILKQLDLRPVSSVHIIASKIDF